ncbi:hypothetical protein M0R45_035222 [Rubus argutus]|uniref:Uncharacterized protein n=1 Tax=Rubus argutus TaxID=59490 RepID=A0AAW1VXU5_RUBAR
MSTGCFRGNLDANRIFVVDHCKVEIPDAADDEKHYVQGYIELIFWWFGKRGGLLDVVQFLELLKFERIRDLNQFRQLTYHYLWMSSKERLFLPLMFQLYLNYNEDSLMHILKVNWRQAYNDYILHHRTATINLPSAVGPKAKFKALLAVGQGGFHYIGVAGDAYPNIGIGELELIPDHAMDYVEEFITMRFPALYKSIFGFLLHWGISMDILDRWASEGTLGIAVIQNL